MPQTLTLIPPSDRAKARNSRMTIDIHDEEFALDWGYNDYPFQDIIVEEEWLAWWSACGPDSGDMSYTTSEVELTMRYYEDTADYGMTLRMSHWDKAHERWRVAKKPMTLARQALRYLAESGDIRVARLTEAA